MAGEAWSFKRAAWAYGCAKKGSAEEADLLARLMDFAKARLRQEAGCFCVAINIEGHHPSCRAGRSGGPAREGA